MTTQTKAPAVTSDRGPEQSAVETVGTAEFNSVAAESHRKNDATALKALKGAGLSFTEIVTDGRFHRGRGCHDAEWLIGNGGKLSTGKEWLTVSAGDLREIGGEHVAQVVYRSWHGRDITQTEIREVKAATKAAKASAKTRITEEQTARSYDAMHIWASAKVGPHPYLEQKGLPHFNTKVHGRALLIPAFDISGWFCSIQFISHDGRKQFLAGGKAAGCYHPINWYFGTEPKLYIAEGWATAAAIATVMNVPAVAAFSAGNLLPVAKKVRAEKPDLKIVICADNDQWTDGNPGIEKAEKAARAVGGRVIVPKFDSTEGRPTDWWDLFRQQGRI